MEGTEGGEGCGGSTSGNIVATEGAPAGVAEHLTTSYDCKKRYASMNHVIREAFVATLMYMRLLPKRKNEEHRYMTGVAINKYSCPDIR